MFFPIKNMQVKASKTIDAGLYTKVLNLGNRVMLVALTIVIATIVVCYTHYEHFSMPTQIVGHVSMILAVTAIKIGYLMRCVGLQQLDASRL